MRIYEELFILKPDVAEEGVDAAIDQIKATVTGASGTIDKVEKWGVRRFAYRLAKLNEGYYVLVQFTTSPEVVKEVERRLRVNDLVIKYITVRIDEKLKWLEKRKKIREKRAARKPQMTLSPAAPAVPVAPAMPPAPAAPAPAMPAPAEPVAAAPASDEKA